MNTLVLFFVVYAIWSALFVLGIWIFGKLGIIWLKYCVCCVFSCCISCFDGGALCLLKFLLLYLLTMWLYICFRILFIFSVERKRVVRNVGIVLVDMLILANLIQYLRSEKGSRGLVLPSTSVTCDKNYKKPLFSMAEIT